MKSFNNIFAISDLTVTFLSCTPQYPADQPQENNAIRSVSDSYKPPVFTNDNRVERILGITPDLRQLIEDHSEARHISGVAWGIVVDDELAERQQQVADLIRHWDEDLEKAILSENLYLDKPREQRMTEVKQVLDQAGPIQSIGAMEPFNQLRGKFDMTTGKGSILVFFTLTPEKEPKVQFLSVSFKPGQHFN